MTFIFMILLNFAITFVLFWLIKKVRSCHCLVKFIKRIEI